MRVTPVISHHPKFKLRRESRARSRFRAASAAVVAGIVGFGVLGVFPFAFLGGCLMKFGAMADVGGDGKPQVHKSCRALALSLVKCLDSSSQEERRSYEECALDKDLGVCRDIRDNYMKCKHEQVGLVVRERLFNNPELLRVV